MKDKIFATLTFLRLLDENKVLSITNILVIIFAIKFALVPLESASITDIAMALSAMGVYMGKKVVNGMIEAKKNAVPSDIVEKLKKLGK